MNENERADQQVGATDWADFAQRLAAYAGFMTDVEDHLVLETPAGSNQTGTTPYAQLCGAGDGVVRAELSGNPVLSEQLQLSQAAVDALVAQGWNLPDEVCTNYSMMVEIDLVGDLAQCVADALEDHFALPHASLLTAHAWGPASDMVGVLGLTLIGEVPVDVVADEVAWDAAFSVRDHAHLVDLTRDWLVTAYDPASEQDADGDFVIDGDGFPVYVRARNDQPVIQVFACVVDGVRNRRQAAVEVAILNRRHSLTKFNVMGDSIWLYLTLPAMPFVPAHLAGMVPEFFKTIEHVREDLALRTGGKERA